MPYFTTIHFLHKYGRKKLIWLIKARRSGLSEQQIARELHLSKARISQICRRMFRVVYLLQPGTADALRFEAGLEQKDVEEIEEVLRVDPVDLLKDRTN